MSDLNLKLTQTQFKFLLELSRSIPTVFAGDPDEVIVEQLPPESVGPAKKAIQQTSGELAQVVHLNPELGVTSGHLDQGGHGLQCREHSPRIVNRRPGQSYWRP